MKKTVESLANIAILVAAVLLCWLVVSTHIKSSHVDSTLSDGSNLIGLNFPPLAPSKRAQAAKTLVLAIRSDCHFCEESVPFYRRLSGDIISHGSKVHLLAVMPDDLNTGQAFLDSYKLHVDGLFSQNLTAAKIDGTPTLLLVSTDGRVEKAWVGELDAKREQLVIDTVNHE